jgi:hypothetical protein
MEGKSVAVGVGSGVAVCVGVAVSMGLVGSMDGVSELIGVIELGEGFMPASDKEELPCARGAQAPTNKA